MIQILDGLRHKPAMIFGIMLATMALLGSPAFAATYWVSPTGSASNSGADSTSNAKTLAWFNANAVAGDICRFKSGTYTDGVDPQHDGNSSTHIRYYGFPQSPGAVTVAYQYFGYGGSTNTPPRGSYCTLKWVRCSGSVGGADIDFQNGTSTVCTVYDSLVNVSGTNSGGISFKSKACVFDSLNVTISGANSQDLIDMNMSNVYATSNLIENSKFTTAIARTGDQHVLGLTRTGYNMFFNNTFNITLNSISGYWFPLEMYRSYYNAYQNNTWNIVMNSTAVGTSAVWGYRDSSSYCRFVGNTVNVTGPGLISMGLAQAGSFPGSTGHMYFGNNLIKIASPQTGGVWYYQNGARGDTCEFNVIASGGSYPAWLISGGDFAGCIYRHNTFYTRGGVIANLATVANWTGSRLSANVFYGGSANGAGSSAAVQMPALPGAFDSVGVVYNLGGSAGNALRYNGSTGTPGTGGNYGIAGKAVWGSPQFVDSSFTTLDAHLRTGSIASGKGDNGTDAGAYPFGGASSDVTPPSAVANLDSSNVSTNTLLLSWTAPGDDANTGTASIYDLRYSTSAITSGNFASATPVTPMPTPLVAGTPQQYIVQGLLQNTNYWFALRTRDEAGNWSGISNVVALKTRTGDITPPAAIQDLAVGP